MTKRGITDSFLLILILFFLPWASGVIGAETKEDALPVDSPVLKTESFEGNLPSYVSVAKGKVSISELRAQDGARSLRWDWVPGDTLTFNIGSLGNINVWTGYGGYSRSAFGISVFNNTSSTDSLTFRWKSGEETGASFKFPLIFRGWQRVCYHYSYNSKLEDRKGEVLSKTDHIVIEAPASGDGGTVYFDTIDFNKPVDFRGGREPVAKLWKPIDLAELKDPDWMRPPTEQELAAVKYLSSTLAHPGNRQLIEAMIASVEKLANETYGLHQLKDGYVAGYLPANRDVPRDLLSIAKLWLDADHAHEAPRLETAYILLDDYFRDMGAVAQGSVSGLNWYGGRNHGDACFIMRDVLRDHKRLERVRDCLKFNWGYDNIFTLPAKRQPMGMDYFYIDTRYLLDIALMHDSPEAIVSNLRAFAKRFNVDVLNTVEPDGSLYHHGFYNFPYVSYTLPVLAQQIKLLAPTPFAVSRDAFEKVKTAAMNMRYFCNLTDAPIFMHGRHPGRLGLDPSQYLLLAEAGRTYNHGKLDRDLATAYLRFVPQDSNDSKFVAEGIVPEPAPQGNLAMNYAGLMGHRRGEWLAVVRGYGKFLPAQESYANANRSGLFLGNGYLDVLATGNPINLVDSGCDVAHGWDWRYLDGTTSFEAPYEQIANGNGTLSERSDITFIGGLSHERKNGVFVMPLHSKFQYSKALPPGKTGNLEGFFAANKTYFFFGDHIVCLGSGISLPDSPFPVRTTLFQKHLKEPVAPILVDGQRSIEFPFKNTLAVGIPHTLMDIQNTGYYLPAGQKTNIVRQHQKSRDGHDQLDTEGDYATVWLDHGVNPSDAGYEYAVIPNTTPEAMAEFESAMANVSPNAITADMTSGGPVGKPQGPASIYRVYSKDNQAHIVYDRPSKTWGCVFLKAGKDLFTSFRLETGDPLPPLQSVDRSCLVMMEKLAGNAWHMSVCDPDLNLVGVSSQPRTLTLMLRGVFSAAALPAGVHIQPDGTGGSVLTVECRDGASYDLELKP